MHTDVGLAVGRALGRRGAVLLRRRRGGDAACVRGSLPLRALAGGGLPPTRRLLLGGAQEVCVCVGCAVEEEERGTAGRIFGLRRARARFIYIYGEVLCKVDKYIYIYIWRRVGCMERCDVCAASISYGWCHYIYIKLPLLLQSLSPTVLPAVLRDGPSKRCYGCQHC